ncbi:hypothetical protein V1575_22920 (plasmid) [Enterobacter hormaechei subsp. xiangfangensis]
MDGFAAAAGSILFSRSSMLSSHYRSSLRPMRTFSRHSSAIAQYAVWLALAEKGIGANLQHYNPLIDEDIRTEWNVPPSLKLRAHMNFGAILSPASEKAFMGDEKRFIVAKQS